VEMDRGFNREEDDSPGIFLCIEISWPGQVVIRDMKIYVGDSCGVGAESFSSEVTIADPQSPLVLNNIHRNHHCHFILVCHSIQMTRIYPRDLDTWLENGLVEEPESNYHF
jgi:hypothetical protein